MIAALAEIKRQEALPVFEPNLRMRPSMLDQEGEYIPEPSSRSSPTTSRMNSPVSAAKWHYANDTFHEIDGDALTRPFLSLLPHEEVIEEPDLVSSSDDEEDETPVPPRKSRKLLKIDNKISARSSSSFTNKMEDAVL